MLRLLLRDDVQPASLDISEYRGQHFRIRAQRKKRGIRKVRTRSAVLLVVVHAAGQAVDHARLILRSPMENHQLLRILYRQISQQNRIHEAEDGGVGADAERERNGRDRGEQRIRSHGPQAIAQVLQELLPKCPGPHGSAFLP